VRHIEDMMVLVQGKGVDVDLRLGGMVTIQHSLVVDWDIKT
jgi:hypothetical protein